MNKSEHKLATRKCPECNQAKTYPLRNTCCSTKCARNRRLSINGKQAARSVEGFDSTGDNAVLTRITSARITTHKQLIELCAVDENEWEVERWLCNKWDQAAMPRVTGESGNWTRRDARPIITELFQVKVWLKRKTVLVSIANQIEALRKKAEGYAPKYPAIIVPRSGTGNMAEICIYDHHFAGLIWGRETGWEDWDLKLSDEAFHDGMSTLLSRSKGYGIDRIMFSLGNDLQNTDNRAGTTEAGTPQSSDGRYQKACEAVQGTAVWAIEACLAVAPRVDVPMIYGNHDPLTTFHLGGYLKAWFRNCGGVDIDNEPRQRKYYQHGTVMIGMTHGNKVKVEDYLGLMAVEQPAMWADTTWREMHTGHIHTKRGMTQDYQEIKGVTVRTLTSLRPPCSWTAEMGYVGNIRSAESLIWNDKEGLIGTAVFSIPRKKAA